MKFDSMAFRDRDGKRLYTGRFTVALACFQLSARFPVSVREFSSCQSLDSLNAPLLAFGYLDSSATLETY